MKRLSPIKVKNGELWSFKVTSELYDQTDSGDITIEDALSRKFVGLGDGCDYRFTKFDLECLQIIRTVDGVKGTGTVPVELS